jgi:UDP-N-acetylglucosamine acyltransferase
MAIHPLAVVDPEAEIHPDATVGPFCCVRGRVTIAAGAELRNHVTVYGRATIGAGVILFPGAVVGSDPQDLKFHGEDSETVIGAHCRIHEMVTVSKGTASGGMRTVIGDHSLIMAYAHIAHDCELGERVVIGNNSQLAGHIKVGRKATIGGMVGLHHFTTIGELAYVGSMSGVRFDIPPFVIADGNPAEPRNINHIGMRRDGWDEDEIKALREAFRGLYHDRSGTPLSAAVERVRAAAPAAPEHPVQRLCSWLSEHLEVSIKGRAQEATRQPAIGGAPARAKRPSGDLTPARG